MSGAFPNPDGDETTVNDPQIPGPAALVSTSAPTLFVIPCGQKKTTHRAPARYLYASAHFAWSLRQVETAAVLAAGTRPRVRVLSALHGLVEPDRVLDPYDVTWGDPDAIDPDTLARQLRDLGPRITATAFLPAAYLAAFTAAADLAARGQLVERITVHDAFAGTTGIGRQRHVLAGLLA